VRIPAVALAAAFVCGIVLGLSSVLARFGSSSQFLLGGFLAAGLLLLAGLLFVRLGWLTSGVGISLLCWIALGMLGALIAQQPLPADHVVTLVDGGRLDWHSPLRWYGKLRDEPTRLPWGYGYEIDLSGVDYHGDYLPLRGGMRLALRHTRAKARFLSCTRAIRSPFWRRLGGHRCLRMRARLTGERTWLRKRWT
jgi:hypothetical protein